MCKNMFYLNSGDFCLCFFVANYSLILGLFLALCTSLGHSLGERLTKLCRNSGVQSPLELCLLVFKCCIRGLSRKWSRSSSSGHWGTQFGSSVFHTNHRHSYVNGLLLITTGGKKAKSTMLAVPFKPEVLGVHFCCMFNDNLRLSGRDLFALIL